MIFIGFIFSAFYLFKPKTITLSFLPYFGKDSLVINKNYFSETINDSVSIQSLRFYLSDINLIKNGRKIYQVKNQPNLIDISKKLQVKLSTPISN
jgi:hypothetical protein